VVNTADIEQVIETRYERTGATAVRVLRESPDNHVLLAPRAPPLVIRISKRLGVADVDFELDAVEFLHDRGLPVATYLPTRAGERFTVLDDGAVLVAFRYVEGRALELGPNRGADCRHAATAGSVLAEFHVPVAHSAPHRRGRERCSSSSSASWPTSRHSSASTPAVSVLCRR
jgi:Ser/Thr protein kinase RdoA (MazF antagonist)